MAKLERPSITVSDIKFRVLNFQPRDQQYRPDIVIGKSGFTITSGDECRRLSDWLAEQAIRFDDWEVNPKRLGSAPEDNNRSRSWQDLHNLDIGRKNCFRTNRITLENCVLPDGHRGSHTFPIDEF